MRLLIVFLLLTLTACKLSIQVPEGGTVSSASGGYSCSSNQTCDIDVNDIYFNETFTAQPSAGYQFTGWRKREKGLCGGRVADCELSTAGFADNPGLMNILESSESFYLEPGFELKSAREVARLEVSESEESPVTDANGKVIGGIRMVDNFGHMIGLNFEGIEETFYLHTEYYRESEEILDVSLVVGLIDLFYEAPECDRQGKVYKSFDVDLDGNKEGVEFSKRPKGEAAVGPEGFVWIPRPGADYEAFSRGHMQSTSSRRYGGCLDLVMPFRGRFIEMIPTNLKLKLPLTFDPPY
ncbi:hypothetical protein [Pseudohalioglobus lutimaris]|uniref:hypothetical protein n=1 Tax=Pseudohalioglobus lutimaris TaxID=1737061 RepID=UPI001055EC70|nr:hypothetical protein [Pseudohalioglobus lutimaris]